MKNPERLIGRKVKGFKFKGENGFSYLDSMDKLIGKIGIISSYHSINNCFVVEFDNDSFYYPADQIEAHLVEKEIPTLSDGVMMLVSNDGRDWLEREVIGQKNEIYYAWNGYVIFNWRFCKPLEPTKEEQLTAILGSDEKVSEIMELFNDKK